ncbi:NAD-dependent epimerase/dehydratase family protein [Janthinobacterium sp. RB2P8]|uniref:NAD-dependent epimerase/dehydratase family protein n=1 Tax=Janthinobacterium sp. RB2P8 TaxID=3424191 RepID=UPI003F1FFEE0
MANKRIALLTGGTGFIGSNLIRRLLKDGWETHIITRPNSDLSILGASVSGVKAHLHDGTTEGMADIVKSSNPTVVFHLASLFLSQHTSKDVVSLINSNVLFSSQLLEAMSLNKVRYLINTGTAWQNFENAEYNPVCLYAATKQAFEAIIEFYTQVFGLSAITLKLHDSYGPDDARPKLFTLLRRVSMSGEALLMSPGEQLLDLVYIDDILDAYMLAVDMLLLDKIERHTAYVVSADEPIKLKDLVAVYGKAVSRSLNIEWGARPYRLREVMVPWNSGTRMPEWQPKVSLLDGIAKMELINN